MKYLAILIILFLFFVSNLYTKAVTKNLGWAPFDINEKDASEIAENATDIYNKKYTSTFQFKKVTEVEWNTKPFAPKRPFALRIYFTAQTDYTDLAEDPDLEREEDLYYNAKFCVICWVNTNNQTVMTVLKLTNENDDQDKECKLDYEGNKKNVKTTTTSNKPPR
uniref:Cystatin domain-containing protein n=1 Tax=Strongyloides stercoralis TaxID=6248 RepID=A0A0K0DSY7_STRER